MAHELLSAFSDNIGRLSLIPSGKGRFEVSVNGELIFSRAETRRYPEVRELAEKIAAKLS